MTIRIKITSDHRTEGKTTAAILVLRALRERGYRVDAPYRLEVLSEHFDRDRAHDGALEPRDVQVNDS